MLDNIIIVKILRNFYYEQNGVSFKKKKPGTIKNQGISDVGGNSFGHIHLTELANFWV